MRILQVIHQYPKENAAGSENYTRQISQGLSGNHQVAILTMGEKLFDGPYGSIQKREDHPIPVFAYFRHPENSDMPQKEYWNPGFDPAFASFLSMWKPDVIHFQHALQLSISMFHIAASMNIPTFFTAHDFWAICPNIIMCDWHGRPCNQQGIPCHLCMSLKFKAPRILLSGKSLYTERKQRMLKALDTCQRILCPSLILKNAFEKMGLNSQKLYHWPFGIDLKLSSKATKSATPIKYPVQLGYTGTLARQKGVDVLLKAFNSLPDITKENARLRIFGDPQADAQTSHRVAKWQKRYNHPSIIFEGSYSINELSNIHKSLDLVIVPSIWFENRPLTVLEAFASGNPVIGSDIGGISELLKDNQGGWKFSAGSSSALAQILKTVIDSPDLIAEKQQSIPVIPDLQEEILNLENLYRRCFER